MKPQSLNTMVQRQTFDISFYCRQSKAGKNGLAPVELSIIINGERHYLTLQRKEYPAEFKSAMASKKTNPIKTYCEHQRTLINQFVQDMAFAGVECTAGNLRECLKRGYVSMQYSLGDLWRDILDNERAKLTTGDIGEQTYKKYILAHRAFNAANNFTDETPAAIVDVQHIHRLQFYLREKGLSQPTIYNYHARTQSAFTLAFNRGKIKANPYAGYTIAKGKKKPIVWLTEEELATIEGKDFGIERLDKVRDLFLFQCYSGLSYADMALLHREDYKLDDATQQLYIEKQRKKTGETFFSILLPGAKAILEKYDFQLPVLTNQRYNAYLKEIQDVCGIDKVLHSHLGRTTYVCYLNNNNVSTDEIAALVGHSSSKTTIRYYAAMDRSNVLKQVAAAVGLKPEPQPTKRTSPSSVAIALNNAISPTPASPGNADKVINEYLDKTIFRQTGRGQKNATLVQLEDEIINQLVALKRDKENPDAYKAAFNKAVSRILSRAMFQERKERECRKNNDTDNQRKAQTYKKSSLRLLQRLQVLNKDLFGEITAQ